MPGVLFIFWGAQQTKASSVGLFIPSAGLDDLPIGGAPESLDAIEALDDGLTFFQRHAEQAGGQAVGDTGIGGQHAHAVKVGGGPEGGGVDEVVVAHTIDEVVALIVAAGDEGEVAHFDSGHRGGAAGVDVRGVPRVFHTADPLGAVGLGADGPQVAAHADESAGQAAGLSGLSDHLHGVAFAHAAAQHCDIHDLVIDDAARTVFLTDPEMSLDVGSVGKGYAVEMVAQAAEARGLTSALISVGGNLRAIGTKPDGSQWVGGVEDPWNASDVYTGSSSSVAAVKMSDLSLVTSGDYQRYYLVDGVRYHHLIDPATLWPAAYFDGVSVLAPDSGVADCLTTGLFCMPLEEGQAIIESLDGVEALWCTTDGQIVKSSGWDEKANG